MTELTLTHFIGLAAFLFCMGLLCILTKRNAIGILMGVELILNAANINLVAAAKYIPSLHLEGLIFAILVIVLAAGEAAIVLAIVLHYYNRRDTVDVEVGTELKG